MAGSEASLSEVIWDTEGRRTALVNTQICTGLIMIIPAIAALVIASQYDETESVCNNDTIYSVDLRIYLYCSGGISIGYFCLILIAGCYEYFHPKIKNRGLICIGYIGCVLTIFHLLWAILGISIYAAQMSMECQQQDIGKMIFASSIIQLTWSGLICFCQCLSVLYRWWFLNTY